MTAQPTATFDFSMLDAATALALKHQGATRFADDRLELLVAPNFLSPQECALFVRMIDRDCSPSPLVIDPNRPPAADFRTSDTCYFKDTLPVVELLELRLSLFFNMHPSYGERIQGQRYRVGQQFKPHSDYFPPSLPDFLDHCGASGNRTWTGMVYLNEPEAGGETWFPELDHAFAPQTGTLLAWNNLHDDGRPNPVTTHAGRPVEAGQKYVLTKWYRQGVFKR